MIRTLLILYINRFKRERNSMILMTLSIAISLITLAIISFHYSRLASPIYPEYNKESARFLVSDWAVTSGETKPGFRYSPIKNLDNKIDKAIDGVVTDKIIFVGPVSCNTIVNSKAYRFQIQQASANIFSYLQFDFISGEPFVSSDRDKPYVPVVISDRLSMELFGTVESVGESLDMGRSELRVCGVVKEVANSVNFDAECYALVTDKFHLGRSKYLFVSSSDSKTVQLNSRLQKLAEQESEESGKIRYSLTTVGNIEYGLTPLKRVVSSVSGLLYLLLSIYIVIPTICLHNILSGSLKYRISEIGIRRSFGASRVDMMIRLIAENIISISVGGFVGIILSIFIIMSLYSLSFTSVVYTYLQWRMVIGSLLIFLLVGILSGVIPAYRVSKRAIVLSINSK